MSYDAFLRGQVQTAIDALQEISGFNIAVASPLALKTVMAMHEKADAFRVAPPDSDRAAEGVTENSGPVVEPLGHLEGLVRVLRETKHGVTFSADASHAIAEMLSRLSRAAVVGSERRAGSEPTVITMGLTFGAYKRRENMLTHAWRKDGEGWTPLCGRVLSDAYCLNDSPADDQAPPTCTICIRHDPRRADSETGGGTTHGQ